MTVSISRRQLALAGIAYGLTQDFPAHANQPLKLVSPYSPGGGGDGMARALAEIFATRFETSTIVDNRPGAGGALGLAQGLKAQPDGNTLTVVASSPLASLPLLVRFPMTLAKT